MHIKIFVCVKKIYIPQQDLASSLLLTTKNLKQSFWNFQSCLDDSTVVSGGLDIPEFDTSMKHIVDVDSDESQENNSNVVLIKENQRRRV